MAYREDLEYFYQDGYGHEINYLQATPPFQDLVSLFLQVHYSKRNFKIPAL
jgi:hypothetical protein